MYKMDKIKPLPASRVIKALEKIGFQQIRQKGSHLFMRHPDGRATIITVHPGKEIGKGVFRKIINDANVKRDNEMNGLT